MAYLGLSDSELNAKNLTRIKADVKQLFEDQKEAQESVDQNNADIRERGPSIRLEESLEVLIEEQKSVRMRANLVVSVIGVSIEYLTEFSRDPSSVIAIKDLLETIMCFTDASSIAILTEAFGVIQDANFHSCTYVLEDLERALKSLSEQHLARSTKILQATQLAVRDLAQDPYDRRQAKRDNKRANKSASGFNSILASSQDHRGIYQPKAHSSNLEKEMQDLKKEVKDLRKELEHLKKEMEDLREIKDVGARYQALEDLNRARGTHEAGAKIKEEDESSQTKATSSRKRPPPASVDERHVKRSRS